jgi:peptide/nickel transport system substrate-binding protein
MQRRFVVILLTLALIFSLAACNNTANTGNSNSPAGSAGAGSAASPATAANPAGSTGKTEITISRSIAPSSLEILDEDNPMATSATYLIFDRLVDFDPVTNEWLPQIATSWKQVDDVTWDFTINLDVTFHNGDKLTMDDIVYSFNRMADFPRAVDNWNMVDKVSYQGNVFTIKFKNSYISTPAKVLVQSFIVDKAYIEANGKDAIYLKPVATGPYKVTAFTPLASVDLEAYDGYYGKKPSIDIIHYIAIPENDARYIALESGQIQFAGDLDKISYDLAANDPNLAQIGSLSKNNLCIAFNCKRAPFDNVNVRRALVTSLNIEAYAAFNNEKVAKSLLYTGYDDIYYEGKNYPAFDLQKAKEMLAAEGYNEKNPLKFELLCVVPYAGQEMWQADLKSIGVEMTLSRPEFGTYIARETSSDFDVLTTGQGNRGNNPYTDLDRFSNDMLGSRNFTLYTTPAVQDLIDQIRVTTDETERTNLSHQLEDLLSQDCPMVGLYNSFTRGAVAKGLEGIVFNGWTTALVRDAFFAN